MPYDTKLPTHAHGKVINWLRHRTQQNRIMNCHNYKFLNKTIRLTVRWDYLEFPECILQENGWNDVADFKTSCRFLSPQIYNQKYPISKYFRNYFSNIFNPYLNSPQYSSKQVQKNIINTTFSESLSNFIVFINKKAPEFPRPNPCITKFQITSPPSVIWNTFS